MSTITEETILIVCLWPGKSEKVFQFTTGKTSFRMDVDICLKLSEICVSR